MRIYNLLLKGGHFLINDIFNKMKQKDIILLVVPMFILVVAWIVFSIYHNSVTSTIPEALNVQITPIEGKFDKETINNIKKRERILPSFEATSSPSENAATEGASLQ